MNKTEIPIRIFVLLLGVFFAGKGWVEIQALHFGSVKVDSPIRYQSEDIKEMFRRRSGTECKV